MNRLVQHRDLVTHYAVLVAGLTLTIVGGCLSFLATSALSGRKFTDDVTQPHVSWMCIVPGVTCVIVGGVILLRLSRGKVS